MISSQYLDEQWVCSEGQKIGVSFVYNIPGGTGSGGTKNRVESRIKAAQCRCWLDQLPKYL